MCSLDLCLFNAIMNVAVGKEQFGGNLKTVTYVFKKTVTFTNMNWRTTVRKCCLYYFFRMRTREHVLWLMNCIRKWNSKHAHYKIHSHVLASTGFSISLLNISRYFALFGLMKWAQISLWPLESRNKQQVKYHSKDYLLHPYNNTSTNIGLYWREIHSIFLWKESRIISNCLG